MNSFFMEDEQLMVFRPSKASYDAMVTYLKEHDNAVAIALAFTQGGLRWWIVTSMDVVLLRLILFQLPTLFDVRGVGTRLSMSMTDIRKSLVCIHEILRPECPCRLFFDIEDNFTGDRAAQRLVSFTKAVHHWTSCRLNKSFCKLHGDDFRKTCGACRKAAIAEEATFQHVVFSACSPSKLSFHVSFFLFVFASLELLKKAVSRFVSWLHKRKELYADCFRSNGECIVDETIYEPYHSMRMPFMSKIEAVPPSIVEVHVRPLVYQPTLSCTTLWGTQSPSNLWLLEMGSIQRFSKQYLHGSNAWPPLYASYIGYAPLSILGTTPDPIFKTIAPLKSSTAPLVEEPAQKRLLDFLFTPERLGKYWDREKAKYVNKIGAYWTFHVENGRFPQFCPGMVITQFKQWPVGEKPLVLTTCKNKIALTKALSTKRVHLVKSTLPQKVIQKKQQFMHRSTSNVSIRVTPYGEVIAFCREKCCPRGVRILGPLAELRDLYHECIQK